jgi:hypothetical protein
MASILVLNKYVRRAGLCLIAGIQELDLLCHTPGKLLKFSTNTTNPTHLMTLRISGTSEAIKSSSRNSEPIHLNISEKYRGKIREFFVEKGQSAMFIYTLRGRHLTNAGRWGR